ncbi:hypothetical protein [Paenibacillus sp. FSL H3-0310]|uniref:hypothetical protein n=1 Tax=Paenibacillus sp. FSL H3-0310 TaxID=2921429 RepID=UPI0030F9C43D
MNQQMLFKKLALSALLVSAVAAPSATNAASGAQDGNTKTTAAAVVTAASKGTIATKVTTIDWVDPLELAKTYAPNTQEDWKNTLDQYYKVAGFSVTGLAELVPAELVEGVQLSKEILSTEALPAGYIEAGRNLEVVPVVDDTQVDSNITTSIKAVDATSIAISIPDLSDADKAFFKAQDDLNSAAKSKDATVIKEALANLLDQYKEKIKELETAK